jgi:DNA-binding NarL/FixJ family response regulator
MEPNAELRISVLLVEDDTPTRAHLARAIEANERLALVAARATCAEARAELAATAPHVLLTDLQLPDGSGIDLIREARVRHPEMQSMVITVFGDERSVISSLEAGATGYLLKDGTSESIGESILQLVAGGSPISPPIARHLLRRFQPAPAAAGAEEARLGGAAATPEATLTSREVEILRLIAKGFSFPEIARLLGISAHTVTTHVRHIYGKLEVNSRGEAVYEAVHQGLIRLDE